MFPETHHERYTFNEITTNCCFSEDELQQNSLVERLESPRLIYFVPQYMYFVPQYMYSVSLRSDLLSFSGLFSPF